jgi:hypothetical protein
MKHTSVSFCKRCRFYYGADDIVCAIHPYGPGGNTCIDFQPRRACLHRTQPVKSPKFFPSRERNDLKRILICVLSLSLAIAIDYGFFNLGEKHPLPLPNHKVTLPMDGKASDSPHPNP